MSYQFRSTFQILLSPPPVGFLEGTTVVAGSPDAPVQRLVHLLSTEEFRATIPQGCVILDWQWSSTSGAWRFEPLDPAKLYHVIAYDHTGTYDPVVKLNLTPTVPD
jgi:hypothetical protein